MRVGVSNASPSERVPSKGAGASQGTPTDLHHSPRQRIAVRMDARGGEAEHDIAGGDIAARQERITLGGADGKAGKVVVAGLVETGHFGGLAANQRAAGLLASGRHAHNHLRADVWRKLSTGEVVEEEQWLGTLHHEVVDRHGDEVDADGVVPAGLDRDFQLGSDPVGRRHQHRIGETGALEVEQPAKAADLGVRARARSGAHQRLDQLHHAVAGIDVDTGLGIGEAFVRHGIPRLCGRLLRRNRRLCNGAIMAIIATVKDAPPLGEAQKPGRRLSIPNLITLGRICWSRSWSGRSRRARCG